jgi:hypothetical protein
LLLIQLQVEEQEEGTERLPKHCLPANLSSYDQLKYVLHLVAPGTLLGGRPIMVLALLAINTSLDKAAREVLTTQKGKWLDFSYFQEEGPMKDTPKTPENYSLGFLRMLKNHTEFLTPEETDKVTRLLRISHLLNLPNIELEVEVREKGCLDGYYYSHVRECTQCKTLQPLSLITESLVCGYCVHGSKAPVHWDEDHKIVKETMRIQRVNNIQCTICFAMYARDPKAIVPGRAMCHACRGINTNVKVSPTQKCTECQVDFLTYHGLPNQKCGHCHCSTNVKKQRYQTRRARAKDVFTHCEFLQIYHSAGIYADDYNVGFLKLNETVTLGEMIEPTLNTTPLDAIVNKVALFTKMCNYAKGSRRDIQECDLCCNQVQAFNLGNACGRKGCTQRLCHECGTQWYGVLKPGAKILTRHLVCPFCTRKPDARVIRRWCPNILWFTTQGNLDPEQHHAWCVECNRAKVVGARQCGAAEEAVMENWRCDDCINPPTQVSSGIYKHCPSCSVLVERTHGCNHITCTCGAHWCFECGKQCESATATYDHMRFTHGRIYDHEELIYEED